MKKISNKNTNKILSEIPKISTSYGITLIALIITIIILLILAGVTINLTLGENGLFNTAKRAGEEYEKAGVKEEIEYAILDIKIEKLQNGEELTMDILEQELSNKLKDIVAEKDDEGQIVGEYKGYDYTITKVYEVIVEKAGVKPVVTYTLSDETIGINELTITLKATISEGNITKIIKPDGNYEENVEEVKYKVTQNGKYKFIVESSNDTKTTKIIQISTLKPIEPVIETSGSYPTLTLNGVEEEEGKVKIIYEENEKLENYYSEDNGATWEIYTGEFKSVSNTIMAKSVVKVNPDCYTQVQVSINKVGPELYDGDENTGSGPNSGGLNGNTRYINITKDLIGKKVNLLVRSTSLEYCYAWIGAYDLDGNRILASKSVNSGWTSIVIPEGSVRLGIWCQYNCPAYEITLE